MPSMFSPSTLLRCIFWILRGSWTKNYHPPQKTSPPAKPEHLSRPQFVTSRSRATKTIKLCKGKGDKVTAKQTITKGYQERAKLQSWSIVHKQQIKKETQSLSQSLQRPVWRIIFILCAGETAKEEKTKEIHIEQCPASSKWHREQNPTN